MLGPQCSYFFVTDTYTLIIKYCLHAWCVFVWMGVIIYKSTNSVAATRARWERVCCWRCATGAAWPLPTTLPLPRHCHAVAATISQQPRTVKSQLPQPDLPPRCHLPSQSVYDDIAIRIPTIIDMDFLPRYNTYTAVCSITRRLQPLTWSQEINGRNPDLGSNPGSWQ